jgi:hypothetical protein
MADYVCPNGHVFPGALTVPCDECGAAVVCEPIAAGMRLHRLLEAAEADLREATAHEAACGRELADARATVLPHPLPHGHGVGAGTHGVAPFAGYSAGKNIIPLGILGPHGTTPNPRYRAKSGLVATGQHGST